MFVGFDAVGSAIPFSYGDATLSDDGSLRASRTVTPQEYRVYPFTPAEYKIFFEKYLSEL